MVGGMYPKRRLRSLIKKGEYLQAVEFGRSLESKFADDADYHFIMGSIFYILEDAKKALAYFDRSLALNDKDTETWLLKGNIHLFLQDKNEVLECCNRILDIDHDNNDAKRLLEKLRDL